MKTMIQNDDFQQMKWKGIGQKRTKHFDKQNGLFNLSSLTDLNFRI